MEPAEAALPAKPQGRQPEEPEGSWLAALLFSTPTKIEDLVKSRHPGENRGPDIL